MPRRAAIDLPGDNADFYGGKRRSQDPIDSGQSHLIYSVRSGVWGSLGATDFTGGETSLDWIANHDRHRNWCLGGALSPPVDARHLLKPYASRGVSARTRNDFHLIGIAWQYRRVVDSERRSLQPRNLGPRGPVGGRGVCAPFDPIQWRGRPRWKVLRLLRKRNVELERRTGVAFGMPLGGSASRPRGADLTRDARSAAVTEPGPTGLVPSTRADTSP